MQCVMLALAYAHMLSQQMPLNKDLHAWTCLCIAHLMHQMLSDIQQATAPSDALRCGITADVPRIVPAPACSVCITQTYDPEKSNRVGNTSTLLQQCTGDVTNNKQHHGKDRSNVALYNAYTKRQLM